MEYAPFDLERVADARSRSSTWPLPDPNQPVVVATESPTSEMVTIKQERQDCESPLPHTPKSEPKKMRNAWGNLSYAELITQAILSTPDKRLTLSEIYDWIVQNVPYFSDKANSPSTAGWKVKKTLHLSHDYFVAWLSIYLVLIANAPLYNYRWACRLVYMYVYTCIYIRVTLTTVVSHGFLPLSLFPLPHTDMVDTLYYNPFPDSMTCPLPSLFLSPFTLTNSLTCTHTHTPTQNSVRHNLSLHSRFNKVQNESSGKSSWWTVDLDAKSNRTSRRNRSQSVDNGNTPSPKTPRKKKERKIKRVKGGTSPNDLSPCDSPTTSSPHLQAPWSPNPSCPSPAPSGSDLSPCYSPVLQSPVLQRSSRNVTPVSPLVSPPSLDQQGATIYSGSNSSLLDDVQLPENSLDSPGCLDMFSQLNLSTRREGMGSSSSLSSLNSPRFAPVTKSPHPIFTFNNPPIDSSGYSSSNCFSDTDNPESAAAAAAAIAGGTGPSVVIGNNISNMHPSVSTSLPVHPPSYEEHVTQQHNPSGTPTLPSPHITPPHRPTCFTPTRSGTHPLQISLAAPPDPNRPRSGSEPAPVNLVHRYPQDIDMDLFNSSGFPDCDVDSIIRTELQYSNGELDFQFDQTQYNSPANNYHQGGDPTLTSVTLGPEHSRMQQYSRTGTSAW